MIINNNQTNPLAFTTMVENNEFHNHCLEPYTFYINHGINFYFEVENNELYAVMESNTPNNEYIIKHKPNKYINQYIKSLNLY